MDTTTSITTTNTTSTRHVTSTDGTAIAYEVRGSGPALVLVDGALCQRTLGPSRGLAEQLAGSFTVYAYDRRGRGESGPGSTPYAAEREVEDLDAVIEAAGGHAHAFGSSSGGALVLEAARRGTAIDRAVVYEAPFIVDDSHAPNDPDLPERLQRLVDNGDRGGAVRLFMRTVGVPAPFIVLMRVMPAWKRLVGVAHTLPYDLSLVIERQQGLPIPPGYYDGVEGAALVIAGGKSPAYMRNGQAALVDALPNAELLTLDGQTHMVKPKVVAPVVADFLRR